jgi:phosphoglucosamine mutase
LSLRFGTDGVRGVAGRELTPELVLALGRVAGRVLVAPGVAGDPARAFLIGRDTRWSGPLLQAAFSAGLAAEGVDVIDLGVLPTPGVAAIAADRGLAGAVISASHNPYADNGVKLLSPGGRKLTDAQEATVEAALAELVGSGRGGADRGGGEVATGDRLGRLRADPEAAGWYRQSLAGALEGRRLDGIRVAVDCANGAATTTAESVLRAAGADVVAVLSASPDGMNINAACGSTDPSALAAAVLVIAIDERGEVVDGDRLVALFAVDLHARGRLVDDTVVVTVMTNLGLHRAMAGAGIKVHQTAVGDRYVLEALDAHGWTLGGEQSGHLIFRNLATTGDGVLSGLLLLDLLARAGRPLGELASTVMVRLPQVLRNVTVSGAEGLGEAGPVWDEVRAVEAELGDGGRVLLRPSGTEKMIRVMVEAPTEDQASDAVERLSRAVSAALGSGP